MAALGGQLACYSPSKRLVAFASPGVVERVVVLVGGLTDGLLALPYVSRLSAGLEACGWSLVQPMLRSSLSGYGVQTLDDDVEDVDELVHWLTSRHRVRQVVLMGHSTGCQDAVHYMLRGAHKDKVAALVLQGPVSDREYMVSSDPATEHWHRMAQEMVERGDGTALLPREAHPVPITAHRFHSLTARMAQDDMFSSDLTGACRAVRLASHASYVLQRSMHLICGPRALQMTNCGSGWGMLACPRCWHSLAKMSTSRSVWTSGSCWIAWWLRCRRGKRCCWRARRTVWRRRRGWASWWKP